MDGGCPNELEVYHCFRCCRFENTPAQCTLIGKHEVYFLERL